MTRARPRPLLISLLPILAGIAACSSPASSPADARPQDAAAPGDAPPDAARPVDQAPDAPRPPTVDAAAPDLPGPDGAPADAAPADAAPADAAPPDAPPPPPDLAPDLAPPIDSACPGAVPAGFGLECGCAGGTIQCDGTCDRPDDSCVPSGDSFVFTNEFLGAGRRLDVYNGGDDEAFMTASFGTSGQFWTLTPLGDGTYRLTNLFLGETRSLEPRPDGSKLFMGTTSSSPTQRWRIRAVKDGFFRLTNQGQGPGRSLDTRNDQVNDPFMGETGRYTGQFWRITKSD